MRLRNALRYKAAVLSKRRKMKRISAPTSLQAQLPEGFKFQLPRPRSEHGTRMFVEAENNKSICEAVSMQAARPRKPPNLNKFVSPMTLKMLVKFRRVKKRRLLIQDEEQRRAIQAILDAKEKSKNRPLVQANINAAFKPNPRPKSLPPILVKVKDPRATEAASRSPAGSPAFRSKKLAVPARPDRLTAASGHFRTLNQSQEARKDGPHMFFLTKSKLLPKLRGEKEMKQHRLGAYLHKKVSFE